MQRPEIWIDYRNLGFPKGNPSVESTSRGWRSPKAFAPVGKRLMLWKRCPVVVASLGAALLVSSCAVGPDFEHPGAPEVSRYTKEPLATLTSSADVRGGQAQHFINGPLWQRLHAHHQAAPARQVARGRRLAGVPSWNICPWTTAASLARSPAASGRSRSISPRTSCVSGSITGSGTSNIDALPGRPRDVRFGHTRTTRDARGDDRFSARRG